METYYTISLPSSYLRMDSPPASLTRPNNYYIIINMKLALQLQKILQDALKNYIKTGHAPTFLTKLPPYDIGNDPAALKTVLEHWCDNFDREAFPVENIGDALAKLPVPSLFFNDQSLAGLDPTGQWREWWQEKTHILDNVLFGSFPSETSLLRQYLKLCPFYQAANENKKYCYENYIRHSYVRNFAKWVLAANPTYPFYYEQLFRLLVENTTNNLYDILHSTRNTSFSGNSYYSRFFDYLTIENFSFITFEFDDIIATINSAIDKKELNIEDVTQISPYFENNTFWYEWLIKKLTECINFLYQVDAITEKNYIDLLVEKSTASDSRSITKDENKKRIIKAFFMSYLAEVQIFFTAHNPMLDICLPVLCNKLREVLYDEKTDDFIQQKIAEQEEIKIDTKILSNEEVGKDGAQADEFAITEDVQSSVLDKAIAAEEIKRTVPKITREAGIVGDTSEKSEHDHLHQLEAFIQNKLQNFNAKHKKISNLFTAYLQDIYEFLYSADDENKPLEEQLFFIQALLKEQYKNNIPDNPVEFFNAQESANFKHIISTAADRLMQKLDADGIRYDKPHFISIRDKFLEIKKLEHQQKALVELQQLFELSNNIYDFEERIDNIYTGTKQALMQHFEKMKIEYAHAYAEKRWLSPFEKNFLLHKTQLTQEAFLTSESKPQENPSFKPLIKRFFDKLLEILRGIFFSASSLPFVLNKKLTNPEDKSVYSVCTPEWLQHTCAKESVRYENEFKKVVYQHQPFVHPEPS